MTRVTSTVQLLMMAAVACAMLAVRPAECRAQNLSLWVDPISGTVSIANQSFSTSLALDSYQITSASGALAPDPSNTPGVGWDSLTDVGLAVWEEASPVSASLLSELNLTSSTSISAGGSRPLGKAFTPSGTTDLQWGYTAPGGTGVLPASIVYTNRFQAQIINLIGTGNVVEATKALLLNGTSASVTLDGYVIRSAGSSLSPAGFNGFAGHSVAGWQSVAPSANALSELNLTASSTLAAGQDQVLDSPFINDSPQDLTLQYHVAGVGTLNGLVLYKSGLAGDVNGDGVVNIFDINLISSNWSGTGPAGDGNYDGVVNIFDINFVSSHWNNTLGGGGGAGVTPVPEPSSLGLLAIGLAIGCGRLYCGRRKRARWDT